MQGFHHRMRGAGALAGRGAAGQEQALPVAEHHLEIEIGAGDRRGRGRGRADEAVEPLARVEEPREARIGGEGLVEVRPLEPVPALVERRIEVGGALQDHPVNAVERVEEPARHEEPARGRAEDAVDRGGGGPGMDRQRVLALEAGPDDAPEGLEIGGARLEPRQHRAHMRARRGANDRCGRAGQQVEPHEPPLPLDDQRPARLEPPVEILDEQAIAARRRQDVVAREARAHRRDAACRTARPERPGQARMRPALHEEAAAFGPHDELDEAVGLRHLHRQRLQEAARLGQVRRGEGAGQERQDVGRGRLRLAQMARQSLRLGRERPRGRDPDPQIAVGPRKVHPLKARGAGQHEAVMGAARLPALRLPGRGRTGPARHRDRHGRVEPREAVDRAGAPRQDQKRGRDRRRLRMRADLRQDGHAPTPSAAAA